MSANMYDHANELERALRASEEFVQLKTMYEAVENDPEAKQVFDEFRNIQLELQQKQMSGVEITQDEVVSAQAIANKVQENETVTKLMEAEQRMNFVVNELNKIIVQPLQDLYGSLEQ